MCEIINEEWRDVAGYEGKYQVSNLGRVKSVPREVFCPISPLKKFISKELIMRPQDHIAGYRVVYFGSTNKKDKKKFFIHRLVAKAFIENPSGKPFVNHKDCDKTHNCIVNLEWMTEQENTQYHYDQVRKSNENF
jgi:hypothetical protein